MKACSVAGICFSGLVLSAFAVACGESLMDEPLEVPPQPAPARSTAPESPKAVTNLAREDVDRTVRAGLGYFLQHASLEPQIVDGKFVGFRVVELKPNDFWAGVDVRPGDVVTSVNGLPIERDIDAYNAFQSLLRAKALRVKLLRGGRERELVYPIVGAPKAVVADAGR